MKDINENTLESLCSIFDKSHTSCSGTDKNKLDFIHSVANRAISQIQNEKRNVHAKVTYQDLSDFYDWLESGENIIIDNEHTELSIKNGGAHPSVVVEVRDVPQRRITFQTLGVCVTGSSLLDCFRMAKAFGFDPAGKKERPT